MHHTFDMIVIDPPFITHEVWRKYATTAKLLLKEGSDSEGTRAGSCAPSMTVNIIQLLGSPLGKVILTTVFENKDLLNELFGANPTVSGHIHFLFCSEILFV